MKTILLLGACFLICVDIVNAGPPLELGRLIEEARDANPVLQALKHKTEAMWERTPQAGAWDDPMLTVGVMNLPTDDFDFNKQDMTQKYVSLSQKIPFPGIPSLRENAAVEAARSAESALENAERGIVRDVKKTYVQLYFVSRALQITRANDALLRQFVDLTQTRYAIGTGLQEDVLRAQVEHEKIRESIIDLQQRRASLQAAMNRLLNRPAGSPLRGEPVVTRTPFSYTAAALEQAALAAHPALQALQHRIRQGETELRLAQKSYVPWFTVTAAYGQRDDRAHARPSLTRVTRADGSYNDVTTRVLNPDRDRPDFFSFLVGINIPIWYKSKQSRHVVENRRELAWREAQYEARKNDVLFTVHDLFARIRRNDELIDLYGNSIIPRAEQSLAADMGAYQVGAIDFLTLLNSEMTLFNYRIEYERFLSTHEQNLADLEAAVGKSLFRIQPAADSSESAHPSQ